MAASKMTAPELREELESYDIPSRGLRKDIYKRLQASHVPGTCPEWSLNVH
jgi:hypothetical protein